MGRNQVLRFILSLLLIMAVQYAAIFFFESFGIYGMLLEMLVDLVLAFLFAFLNYFYGPKLQAFRDPIFHRNVLIYFLVLAAFDFFLYYI